MSSAATSSQPPAKERVASVDALRGFDMFWILGADALVRGFKGFGENRATTWLATQLEHVEWAGFRFYDLIFPLFVFIVGVSIVFSLEAIRKTGSRTAAFKRVLTRTLVLFAVGIIYSGGFNKEWPDIRLLGVLQRIALCYGIAAILYLILRTWQLAVLSVVILVGYWAALKFIPVPGFGAGIIEPGKNLSNYLDALYLPGKKYDGTWDPEGLLSTLPAVGTCLLGIFAGKLLSNPALSKVRRVLVLYIAGALGIAAGLAWGLEFPIVKKIWTSSFVLVAAGWSCVLLGSFYLIIDVVGLQKWALPFIWIGVNPITLYLLNNFMSFKRLAERFVGGDINQAMGKFGPMLVTIVSLTLMFTVARFLYNRKIFIRI